MSIHRTLQHESKFGRNWQNCWKCGSTYWMLCTSMIDQNSWPKWCFIGKSYSWWYFLKKIIATWIFPSDQIYCKNSLKKVFQVTKTEIVLRQMERLLNIGMNHFCLLYCTDYMRIERMKLILPEPIRQFAKGRDM